MFQLCLKKSKKKKKETKPERERERERITQLLLKGDKPGAKEDGSRV